VFRLKKRKKGGVRLFLVYTTSMLTETVGDSAVGLSTLSHTNTVAVY
ncbi:uncharacterized protein METZ01_LOCUS218056, partial [marine metagenome]